MDIERPSIMGQTPPTIHAGSGGFQRHKGNHVVFFVCQTHVHRRNDLLTHEKRWPCAGRSSTSVSPNPRYFFRNLTQGVRDRPLRLLFLPRRETDGTFFLRFRWRHELTDGLNQLGNGAVMGS